MHKYFSYLALFNIKDLVDDLQLWRECIGALTLALLHSVEVVGVPIAPIVVEWLALPHLGVEGPPSEALVAAAHQDLLHAHVGRFHCNLLVEAKVFTGLLVHEPVLVAVAAAILECLTLTRTLIVKPTRKITRAGSGLLWLLANC